MTSNSDPLHRCCDMRPHSGTALYMEWISTQPPCMETALENFQAISWKVQRWCLRSVVNWLAPYLTHLVTWTKEINTHHALHCSCLVSDSTILYYYNTHVSLLQPYIMFTTQNSIWENRRYLPSLLQYI